MNLSPQQAVVVLAECKSMLFHQLIPSAEEQGPGLDYALGPGADSDSKKYVKVAYECRP